MGYFDENDDLKTPRLSSRKSNPFLESESSIATAQRRARRNKEFWCMVFTGTG
jgi:hypothetical protein